MAAVSNLEDVVGGHIWIGFICVAGGLWHIVSKPLPWARRALLWSGEAYLCYSLGALAYMGFLAAYFITVNDLVYPEVFYGPIGVTEIAGVVTARTWLASTHFILAAIFFLGHIWHAFRVRVQELGGL